VRDMLDEIEAQKKAANWQQGEDEKIKEKEL